jgi:general secretion pathway protein J
VSERNRSYQQQWSEIQRAVLFIERDIEQMIDRPITNSIQQVQPAFMMLSAKRESGIEFTRTGYVNPLGEAKQSDLRRIKYILENHRLQRFSYSLDKAISQESSKPMILLDNVDAVHWNFYDDDNKSYSVWPPIADWQDRFPHAIEITIVWNKHGSIRRLLLLPDRHEDTDSGAS